MVELRLLTLPVRRVSNGVPSIEMRIEMQNRNWLLIDLIQSTQGRKSNTVITAQSDELGVAGSNAIAALGRDVDGLARAELEERFVHLALGETVVEGGDWDIAAVGDLGPGFVGVDSGAGVEACSGHLAGAGGANGAGSEAGTFQ